MFVVKHFLFALAHLFDLLFSLLYILLVVRIILSWLQIDYYYNSIIQAIYMITEPILRPFRRLPLQFGMFDFSPIVAFMVLSFLHSFVVGVLREMAYRLAY